MPNQETAYLLKKMRTDAGLTQKELGNKLCTTQPSIARAERLGCSLDFLRKAAEACNCKIKIKIEII